MPGEFLRGREGQELEAYAKEATAPDLIGKVIVGRIVHRADERGGSNWIYEVKVETPSAQ